MLFVTERKIFGDGVNKLGSIGSSVIVARIVGVLVGSGVFVAGSCVVPGGRVADGSAELITNKFGVLVGGKENGVAVGLGEALGTWVCRNGMETGSPLQLDRRETKRRKNKSLLL